MEGVNHYKSLKSQKAHKSNYWAYYLFILLEFAMIFLYAAFTTFGKDAGPKSVKAEDENTQKDIVQKYPLFQDVNVMIFIGFGFLMTFLKNYSW
jgi:ammonium transporter Rh